jgi:NAD(P)-dependent dehydrogenase (short-subunit alcohol dehydrogenase family)
MMKTLIVTGGTGGLGTAVVERLSQKYRCVLLQRNVGRALARPDGLKPVLHVDLTDEQSVHDAIADATERFGAPYGLLHMAGGYDGGAVSETSSEVWNRMIDLNLTSAFLVVRETLALMRRDEPGRIIAISSEATLTKFAGAAAYVVSKSALNTLVELTAAELAGSAITVNALLPTTLDTPASRAAMPDARRVPLERVADAIEFLLSEAAANFNGALIPLRA